MNQIISFFHDVFMLYFAIIRFCYQFFSCYFIYSVICDSIFLRKAKKEKEKKKGKIDKLHILNIYYFYLMKIQNYR